MGTNQYNVFLSPKEGIREKEGTILIDAHATEISTLRTAMLCWAQSIMFSCDYKCRYTNEPGYISQAMDQWKNLRASFRPLPKFRSTITENIIVAISNTMAITARQTSTRNVSE